MGAEMIETNETKSVVMCHSCLQNKQCGQHIYEGRNVPLWNIWLCFACRTANHDGVVPNGYFGKRLVEHLKQRGIPYQLNDRGWIDIPN
jgi:hypothetical protein